MTLPSTTMTTNTNTDTDTNINSNNNSNSNSNTTRKPLHIEVETEATPNDSIRTRALMCHSRLQLEMSPKTEQSIDIEYVAENEIEAIIVEELLRLRQLEYPMEYVELHALTSFIMEDKKHEMRSREHMGGVSGIVEYIVTEENNRHMDHNTRNTNNDIQEYNNNNNNSNDDNGLEIATVLSEDDCHNNKYEYSVSAIKDIVKRELRRRLMKSPSKSPIKLKTIRFKMSDMNEAPSPKAKEQQYTYQQSIVQFNNTTWCIADSCATTGARNHMEDRSVCFDSIGSMLGVSLLDKNHDESNLSFFGVYDGHGGSNASEYLKTHLHHNIIHRLREKVRSSDLLNIDGQVLLLKEALSEGFALTESNFLSMAGELGMNSGSTALTALILDPSKNHVTSDTITRKLLVANTGDSRCVLSVRSTAVSINIQHRPDEPSERQRIMDAGGKVYHFFGQARVNGILAVSRSFGDRKYKDLVVSRPDIYEVDIEEGPCEFMILATDGLWDFVTPQEAVDMVNQRRKYEQVSGQVICRQLVELATERRSKDNISVILVLFKPHLLPLLD